MLVYGLWRNTIVFLRKNCNQAFCSKRLWVIEEEKSFYKKCNFTSNQPCGCSFCLNPWLLFSSPSTNKLEKRSPSSIINQPVWVQSLRETSASHNSRTIHSVKKRRSSLMLEALFIFLPCPVWQTYAPPLPYKKKDFIGDLNFSWSF